MGEALVIILSELLLTNGLEKSKFITEIFRTLNIGTFSIPTLNPHS